MTIKSEREKLEKKLSKVYTEIKTLQETCPHENLTGKYGSNTGNWCSADNSYWVDFSCEDCGKRWSEDQDKQRYRNGSNYSEKGFKWNVVK